MKAVTAPGILELKAKGQKIVCLTAYDVTSGQIADGAGVDLVLVGDSLGNVVFGRPTTLGVTLEEVEHHVRATRPGVERALLVADMPFGSYGSSVAQCVDSAVRLVRAGADAVKLEGAYVEEIQAVRKTGIPVMGHVGMTPQSVNAFGGFRVQGRNEDALHVLEEARKVDEAGVFAMVLELIPAGLAEQVTQRCRCATIGIGAGPGCDGQIQVFHDALGLSQGHFRHAKVFVKGRQTLSRGAKAYTKEVREGTFPSEEHSF